MQEISNTCRLAALSFVQVACSHLVLLEDESAMQGETLCNHTGGLQQPTIHCWLHVLLRSAVQAQEPGLPGQEGDPEQAAGEVVSVSQSP